MSKIIQFIIYGNPQAKARPRFFKKGNFVGTYTPKKTKQYEKSVIEQALKYKPEIPITNPISIKVIFYLFIPISFSLKKRQEALQGKLYPAKRPDLDNLVKSILDPLNTIFWEDDKLITSLIAEKLYSDQPRTEITIQELIEQ